MPKSFSPITPPMDVPSGWGAVETIFPIGDMPTMAPQYDWLIIGAGFTGLAAAQRLGEIAPDDTVLIVDARPVGWGASGRNSGFVIDLPHKYDLDHPDKAKLHKIIGLNRIAIDLLEDQISKYNIACDWSRTGKLQGAVRERGTGMMRKFIEVLDLIGEPYTELDRSGCKEIMGTDYYAGGVFTPGAALVNPLTLVRGLAHNLPPNVTLVDDIAVTKFAPERGINKATLQSRINGEISLLAKKVILAVDPFVPEFGQLKNRILPVMTFASITRPMTLREKTEFQGKMNWGLTPADSAGTTLRMTYDGRLLIRNHYAYAPKFQADDGTLQKVRRSQKGGLDKRFADLAHIPITSTWGGVCGLSRNHISFFGKVADNVFSANCYNGVGIAKGTISGRLLVDLALGRQSVDLDNIQEVTGHPTTIPPDPFRRFGVNARMKLAEWESRAEL